MPSMPGSDAWWPSGEDEWKVIDLDSNHPERTPATAWILSSSLDSKLAEVFPAYRLPISLGSLGEDSATVLKSGMTREGGGGNGGAQEKDGRQPEVAVHRCTSKIGRPCKFMGKCRDVSTCNYCHDEVHQVAKTRPGNFQSAQSQRARDPGPAYHEAHRPGRRPRKLVDSFDGLTRT
ncbi:unnamed protein product [Symbiodinium natans]|uniref:Uncharacterized protein n=1 Tax=Symbiodinium natans TaxID=878477 RepID=A0A812T6K2_9DINO|nr:unnamed protein product [Symbiodinium natans]